jgi:hypothetical protein
LILIEGNLDMPSSDHFRRQADLCLWLATTNHDEKTIATLVAMAKDFLSKADDFDRSRGSSREIATARGKSGPHQPMGWLGGKREVAH